MWPGVKEYSERIGVDFSGSLWSDHVEGSRHSKYCGANANTLFKLKKGHSRISDHSEDNGKTKGQNWRHKDKLGHCHSSFLLLANTN